MTTIPQWGSGLSLTKPVSQSSSSSKTYINPEEDKRISEIARKYQAAVCQIVTPTERGTGCLIEGNLLLTNSHVLDCNQPEQARNSYALFFYPLPQEAGKAGTLYREVRLSLDPDSCFSGSPPHKEKTTVLPADPEHLDFTIVGVKSDPYLLEVRERVFSILKERHPQKDQFACILHYPQIPNDRGEVKFSRGKIHQIERCALHYDTEAERGSSGGAVIDQEGNLIALHYQGIGHCGCDPRHPFCNSGVLISQIVQSRKGTFI